MDVRHRVMFEAKLRQSGESIGLRVFAATLVIAYNAAANVLVVVANRRYSPQALQQAARFTHNTRMQVKLVDGFTIGGWVLRHRDDLATRYPAQLLDLLAEEGAGGDEARLSRFSGEVGGNADTGACSIAGKIEHGWHPSGRIASCDVIVEPPAADSLAGRYPLSEEALIGEIRKETLRRLDLALRGPGITIVRGPAGAGKSVLVQHALRAAEERGTVVSTIDVRAISSSRQMFIRILTALCGINPAVAAGSYAGDNLERLVANAGGRPVSSEMKAAVASILREHVAEFGARRDLNEQVLIDFLALSARPHMDRHRPVLAFVELNKTTSEVLEFLHVAGRALAEAGATVMFELRDGGDQPAIAAAQWDAFVQVFDGEATAGRFRVEPLTDAEADGFLSEILPGLGAERYAVIRQRVGNVPLFLNLAVAWLRETGTVSTEADKTALVDNLEVFFEGISPDQCIVILDRLIAVWRERTEAPFADCIAAVALLDGYLSIPALSIVAPEVDAIRFAERLVDTCLFITDRSQGGGVRVVHDLLLERMTIESERLPFRTQRVAERLLPQLESLITDPISCELKTIDLLAAVGNWQEMYDRAVACGRRLTIERQWEQAARYLDLAASAAKEHPDPATRLVGRARALLDYLEVEILRYRIGREDNAQRFAHLEAILGPAVTDLEATERSELNIRRELIRWRLHYVREDFQAAMDAAKEARSLAIDAPPSVAAEIRGKALSSYAVTLKIMDRKAESLAAFDDALSRLSDSVTVRAERLSNIAAFALRDDPDHALACYRELLAVVQGTEYSFLEVIHVHVDLAMAQFLARRYEDAVRDGHSALRLAESNAVPAQEARARNILGCAQWAMGDVRGADEAFDRAAFASERAISHRFLWRMRTNRSGTALELGNESVAYHNARSAEELIITPRRSNFRQLRDDRTHMRSRWYAALLALTLRYRTLNREGDLTRLLSQVDLPRFHDHAKQVLSGRFPADVFSKSTHMHADRIMITG